MKENPDILLVNVGGTRKKVYQELSLDYSAIEPPFWAALTAGFLRKRGFDVELLDANAENLTYEETVEKIKNLNPRLVDIVVYGQQPSASTQLMSGVGRLCKKIKQNDPERQILLSGLHPSAIPERTMREEECDLVCEGEGFYTLLNLLDGKKIDEIPGLWWRDGKKILHNPREKNINNLTESLDVVAWDLLPWGKYRAHNWQCLDDLNARKNYASLSTSLGCPYKCDFCSIFQTFGEHKVRYWDPSWVVDQIEELFEKYNVNVFKIIDEMFILNPNHYSKIAKGIIERGLGEKINIWAYARVDTIKETALGLLRSAGFKWLCLGFESGNEDILKSVHKGNFTREDMKKISNIVRKHDINIQANYMFGFPKDNLETMQQTLDLALEQNCEFVNMYCATAWPGSKLYDESLKKGVRLPKEWEDYSQHSNRFIPLPTEFLNPEEVLKFRDNAFSTYFNNPGYLKMIEQKFGTIASKHIEDMAKARIRRQILEE